MPLMKARTGRLVRVYWDPRWLRSQNMDRKHASESGTDLKGWFWLWAA